MSQNDKYYGLKQNELVSADENNQLPSENFDPNTGGGKKNNYFPPLNTARKRSSQENTYLVYNEPTVPKPLLRKGILRLGDKDDELPVIKKTLASLNYHINKDIEPNIFDLSLEQAIVDFQVLHDLRNTGIVDQATLDRLWNFPVPYLPAILREKNALRPSLQHYKASYIDGETPSVMRFNNKLRSQLYEKDKTDNTIKSYDRRMIDRVGKIMKKFADIVGIEEKDDKAKQELYRYYRYYFKNLQDSVVSQKTAIKLNKEKQNKYKAILEDSPGNQHATEMLVKLKKAASDINSSFHNSLTNLGLDLVKEVAQFKHVKKFSDMYGKAFNLTTMDYFDVVSTVGFRWVRCVIYNPDEHLKVDRQYCRKLNKAMETGKAASKAALDIPTNIVGWDWLAIAALLGLLGWASANAKEDSKDLEEYPDGKSDLIGFLHYKNGELDHTKVTFSLGNFKDIKFKNTSLVSAGYELKHVFDFLKDFNINMEASATFYFTPTTLENIDLKLTLGGNIKNENNTTVNYSLSTAGHLKKVGTIPFEGRSLPDLKLLLTDEVQPEKNYQLIFRVDMKVDKWTNK